MRRFDHLADVEAFVATAEQGSLTRAAVTLGTTPSMISRALSRLEARLGVQLMRRTTRQLHLTDAGRRYLQQAGAAFALIVDAENEIRGREGAMRGTVRLSVPTSYGHYRLPALLQAFHERHPGIELEVAIGNRNVDLFAEGFDLAIRGGELPDSGLVAHRLEDAPFCLVAAPAYVHSHGLPRDLQALSEHASIGFILPSTGRVMPWLLLDAGHPVDWHPRSRMRVADDVLGPVSLARAGAGICQSYRFIVEHDLQTGRLVEILPQLAGRTRPFSLLHAPQRRLSAAVHALVAMLTQQAVPRATHQPGGASSR